MPSLEYKGWRAAERETQDILSASPARRFMATLNRSPDSIGEECPLPSLWHWLYFLPESHTDRLGKDGHPVRGGFMPPVDLPLRMFAGCKVDLLRPLVLGERAWRSEQVTHIEEKRGRSGRLVFVTVSVQVRDERGTALNERQDYVYRDPGPPTPPRSEEDPIPQDWVMEVPLTPVLLFRFSALTFNSHRIHYDREYAVSREGYPGLVVHGPLIALLMAELVARNLSETMKAFRFRQHAPAFDGETLRVIGFQPGRKTVEMRAYRGDGTVSATGRCRLT